MSKKEMALALYNSLQGEAEQELEHTPTEDFYTDDGVDKIVEALRSPMEQKIVYQKRKYLSKFENVRRYAGETMRSYVNRFRRTQRCLRSVGVDVSLTYDAESMGARLLDRSGLSQEGQRLILVGAQQRLDFELVVESMMLQYPEFRGAPPVVGRDGNAITSSKGTSKGKGGSSRSTSLNSSMASSSTSSTGASRGSFHRKVHLTEAQEQDGQGDGDESLDPIQEEQDDQQEDGEPVDDAGDDEEELILTLTAKKSSSMTLGRKFTGRPKPSKGSGKASGSSSTSTADLKKVTHCTACGALGHWREDPECPLNAGGGSKSRDKTALKQPPKTSKNHKVGILHHQHGATEISSPSATSYGNMFTVNVVGQMTPHQVNEVKINGPEGFAGYMVLDTGCQRTCCGKRWCKAHYQCLKELNLHPNMVEFEDSFKFGKGDPSFSKYKGYFPSAISGQPLLLAASVLDKDIPFLASNPLLTQLGAVFNLLEDTIVFTRLGGKKASIQRLGGHMVVSITDFQHESPSDMSVWSEFSKQDVWQDPHPEFILSYQTRPCVGDLPHDVDSADDPATTLLAEGMAAADPSAHERCQGVDQKHDGRDPVGPSSSRPTTSLSSNLGQAEGETNHMQPREVQAVRKSSRQARDMPAVWDPLDLESGE